MDKSLEPNTITIADDYDDASSTAATVKASNVKHPRLVTPDQPAAIDTISSHPTMSISSAEASTGDGGDDMFTGFVKSLMAVEQSFFCFYLERKQLEATVDTVNKDTKALFEYAAGGDVENVPDGSWSVEVLSSHAGLKDKMKALYEFWNKSVTDPGPDEFALSLWPALAKTNDAGRGRNRKRQASELQERSSSSTIASRESHNQQQLVVVEKMPPPHPDPAPPGPLVLTDRESLEGGFLNSADDVSSSFKNSSVPDGRSETTAVSMAAAEPSTSILAERDQLQSQLLQSAEDGHGSEKMPSSIEQSEDSSSAADHAQFSAVCCDH